MVGSLYIINFDLATDAILFNNTNLVRLRVHSRLTSCIIIGCGMHIDISVVTDRLW